MADVVDLFTRQTTSNEQYVDPAMIEMLEGILERAKAGEMCAFALVGTMTEQRTMTAWTTGIFNDPYMFIGLLENVKHELGEHLSEQRSAE